MALGNSHTNPNEPATKNEDAWVRAGRTFAQGLLLDVAVASAVFLVTVIGDLEWTRVYWVMLGLGLAKSVIQGIVAYLARKWITPANLR